MPPKLSAAKSTNAAAQAVVGDPRWAAVCKRDAAAEGSFVYAVGSTWIYCRPTCPSKLARPENVSFFATTSGAEAAGYRACKRCKPKQSSLADLRAGDVAKLCRLIESSDQAPSLAELSNSIGLSAFHTHRLFKKVTGVTPRAYAAALKAHRARSALESNSSVTDAIYSAGHSSSGRFYATASKRLGMTPTKFKRGGIETEIHFAVGQSSLGNVLVAATSKGLCAIFIGDDPNELVHDLQRRFPQAILVGGDAAFEDTVAKVIGLIEHPQQATQLPLDIRGTAFQQKVWQALTKIPLGKTATYLEIAKAIGLPKGSRAVAQACGANPLAVAIPCHRVVRTDGDVSGYRWGVDRKRTLLQREHAKWNQRLNQLELYLLNLKENNK